jgi:hypothetical protein
MNDGGRCRQRACPSFHLKRLVGWKSMRETETGEKRDNTRERKKKIVVVVVVDGGRRRKSRAVIPSSVVVARAAA